jgi:hypothetical protein
MRSLSLAACGCGALLACSVPTARLTPLETSSTGGTVGVSSSTSDSATGSTGNGSNGTAGGSSGSAAATSGTSGASGSSSSGSGTTTGGSSLCVPPTPTSTGGARFSCHLGDAGRFADPITIVTGVAFATPWHPVGVGDVNGDGNLDIVVTDLGSGDVVVVFGNGDGSFQAPVHSSVPANDAGFDPLGPTALVVAGLGRPVRPSVIVADAYSRSLLVDGVQPNGQLSPEASLPIVDYTWSSPWVADLNCDGIPDLVNSEGSQVTVFLGTDGGTYIKSGSVTPGSTSECLGDFKEDGILDVIVDIVEPNDRPGKMVVFLGVGDGTFSDAGISTDVYPGELEWVVGDVNEDGHLDLLVYNLVRGTSAVLFGRGGGTFTFGPQLSLTTYRTRLLYDLNGDGHLDYVGDTSSGFAVALGNGDGTFQPQVEYLNGFSLQVVAGDLNNDGRPDLIATHSYDANVQIYLNNCR